MAQSHHITMIKNWKREIDSRRDKARNYLITGDDISQVQDDEMQVEIINPDVFMSPTKEHITTVPPVTTTKAVSLPTKSDIIMDFTLNSQQKFAFLIITSHLDGDNEFHTGIFRNFL
jgi:hypothetical protein